MLLYFAFVGSIGDRRQTPLKSSLKVLFSHKDYISNGYSIRMQAYVCTVWDQGNGKQAEALSVNKYDVLGNTFAKIHKSSTALVNQTQTIS